MRNSESGSPANASERVDVLVVGSGAAGLVSALAAASCGCRVRIVEKTPWLGGTTALSEGMIWVPAGAASPGLDSPADGLAYLRASAEGKLDESRAGAYVQNAAAMLSFIEAESLARYELARSSPDYYGTLPGATVGLRAYRPRPLDVRARGAAWLDRIRPPLPTTVAFGGMMLSSDDYAQVLALRRSPRAWAHVGSLALGYLWDRLRGLKRGARLTNGNALIAGLLLGLERRGVRPETCTSLVRLDLEDGRVTGAELEGPSGPFTVRCGAVVIATGGFPGNEAWRRRHFPHVAAAMEHHSLAPATNTGEGIEAALRVGARLDAAVLNAAAWTPVSRVPQRDGGTVPFPHYVDRAKPGIIAVDSSGQRFCNEACPYIRFVPALIRAAASRGDSHVWLVADHRAVRTYGLGAAPPAPGRVRPFVASGYLIQASSLVELEQQLGVPAGALVRTVARFNEHAERGVDPDFARGESAFDQAYGDAAYRPNPCLGPLRRPPFYAVRLYAGDIGTFVGLAVDAHARVLRADGMPIAGLYAAGNDVGSPTGGEYPAAGVTVGAAMTLGFLAGSHAATMLNDEQPVRARR